MIKQYFFLILFLGFIIIPAYAYNSGFQPVYQPPTPPGGIANIHDIGNVTNAGCALGQVLAVNGSAIWACLTLSGTGEINTASNVGVGYGLFKQKTVFDLEFKNIFCAGNLICSSNTTDVRISYTTPAGGGNVTNLNDAGDVVLTSPSPLSVLYYVGTQWIDKIFSVNSVTCGAGQFVNIINNQTGATSCGSPSGSGNVTNLNDAGDVVLTSPAPLSTLYYVGSQWIDKIFSVNSQTGSPGKLLYSINNQTGAITTATIKNPLLDGSNHTDTTAQAPTRGSIIYGDSATTWNELVKGSTGQVLTAGALDISWVTPSSGSGIPMPPKKYGQITPVTSSTALEGLTAGCTILATATYIYDTTVASAGHRSTTAITDGVNGGYHCTGTDRHVFIGANNAYMFSKFQENKITTNRIFIGFHSTTTFLPNNADTILDNLIGVGLCIRTTDTVYQFCRNDGDATTDYATLTTTEDTLNHYIEIYTTDAGVNWCAKLDGGTAVCHSTEIPTTTTRMYAMSTGETDGGATAIIWTQYNFYLQSDR